MLSTTTLLLACLLPQNPDVAVRIKQLPSTIRLGEVVRATLVVESRQQPATPVIPVVDGIVMRLGRPSSNQSVQIVNGRRSASFSWNFPLEVRATAVGKFKLAPVEVTVADKVYRTGARLLEVVKEVTGANFGRVAIQPSSQRVYVHEPIHFVVECAIDSRLQLAQRMAQNGAQYLLVQLEAGWLTEMSGAQPIEPSNAEPGDFVHTVLNETYLQPAKVEVGRDPDGRSYRVFRYTRSFLPTRAG
ncbi:MAG: BatD family protein, partial [Planctomycetota bacterium]|nr:BatD family protein [Planctomycetota bacterium]